MNNNNIDEIFNQALEMLRQGHPQSEILSKFPVYAEELTPLLSLSAALLEIPKNTVPTPMMQKKFALVPTRSLWLAWLHMSKVATVSISLVLLISTFTVIGYQASKASAGQTLFTVKKTSEKLQLILAQDQSSKASLQIKFAQKRLSEAQSVLSNPDSASEEKTAVLEELSSQTNTAVAEVDSVAQADPKVETTQPLLASLDGITNEQQNLLSEITEDEQIKPAASTAQQALTENTEKISEIKQIVAAADSEKALAVLNRDQNTVAILGNITKINKDKVTIEATAFSVNETTVIKDSEGKILALKDLTLETKANIIGQKSQNALTAKQIVIFKSEQPTSVTAKATSTTDTISGVLQTTTPTSLSKPVLEKDPTTTQTQTNPNAATGSFILEDPSPQFVK